MLSSKLKNASKSCRGKTKQCRPRSDYSSREQSDLGLHCLLAIGSLHQNLGLTSYTYRILHEWSFHMKFIKRVFGEFDKFHMKRPLV